MIYVLSEYYENKPHAKHMHIRAISPNTVVKERRGKKPALEPWFQVHPAGILAKALCRFEGKLHDHEYPRIADVKLDRMCPACYNVYKRERLKALRTKKAAEATPPETPEEP